MQRNKKFCLCQNTAFVHMFSSSPFLSLINKVEVKGRSSGRACSSGGVVKLQVLDCAAFPSLFCGWDHNLAADAVVSLSCKPG